MPRNISTILGQLFFSSRIAGPRGNIYVAMVALSRICSGVLGDVQQSN